MTWQVCECAFRSPPLPHLHQQQHCRKSWPPAPVPWRQPPHSRELLRLHPAGHGVIDARHARQGGSSFAHNVVSEGIHGSTQALGSVRNHHLCLGQHFILRHVRSVRQRFTLSQRFPHLLLNVVLVLACRHHALHFDLLFGCFPLIGFHFLGKAVGGTTGGARRSCRWQAWSCNAPVHDTCLDTQLLLLFCLGAGCGCHTCVSWCTHAAGKPSSQHAPHCCGLEMFTCGCPGPTVCAEC